MQTRAELPVTLPTGDGGLRVIGDAYISESNMVIQFRNPREGSYLTKMLNDGLLNGVVFEYRALPQSNPRFQEAEEEEKA